MAFTVVLQRRAQTDIATNVAWLDTNRGAAAAEHWRNGLVTAVVAALETDPHRYPQAEDANEVGIDLREMVYGRGRQIHRVLFTIDGDTVNVHRVRHAAQDRLQPGDV